MINFDEELSKFKPILEIEQAEIMIRNQNLEDMADVTLGIIAEARDEARNEAARAAANAAGVTQAYYQSMPQTMTQNFEGTDDLL